jgi:hypothetical protein
VLIEIELGGGSYSHEFLVVPGSISTILLGRDFIEVAEIGILISEGAWFKAPNIDELIPFTPRPVPPTLGARKLYVRKASQSVEDTEPTVTSTDIISPLCKITPMINSTAPNICGGISLLPFVNNFQHVLSVEDINEDQCGEESEEISFSTPADCLACWDYEENTESQKVQHDNVKENLLEENNPDFLSAPTYLEEDQKQQLAKLFDEFRPMFTKKPGLCRLYKHRIYTGEHPPVSSHLIRMTPGARKAFDETFNELIDFGVIEPAVNCPWSAPAFTVPKPDGTHRFITAYQKLNDITIPDKYPIPRMDDMLMHLGNFKYLTFFDLSKGFYQIEVAEEDRQKTAFISHRGHWQFKRMPMGLSNSPSTFQRAVDAVLGDLKWKICFGYFDDVGVFSNSFEEHLEHLRIVLTKLWEAGFTLHPKKVQLCRRRLKFLGFVIEDGKIFPNPEKVECIRNFPVPKSSSKVQSFLGLMGFYRRFIPDLSTIAKPLMNLNKKGVKFKWTEECQQSFETLINSITELTNLHLPDLNKEFVITTDASTTGLGAVLSQVKDNVRYPIWFASRTLNSAESNYIITELELLAVIWAIRKFQPFIEYTHFVLETDHSAIMWLKRMKEPRGRLARWMLILQGLDFEVFHRPGTSGVMKVPDALSRTNELLFVELDGAMSRDFLIQEQLSDGHLREVREVLMGTFECSDRAKKEKIQLRAERGYLMDDGMLMRYVGPRGKPWEDEGLYWRIWLPESLKEKVMVALHEEPTAGHLGIRKTYLRVDQRFYWEGMHKDIVQFVSKCMKCQEVKIRTIPLAPPSSFHPEGPWQLVFTDLMGPYPKTAAQNTHLLVVVCGFSKYIEIFPLRSPDAKKVTDRLWQVCCRWGVFKTIVSDNGTQFTSGYFHEWCKSRGISPFHISAYHAQSNMTERYNRTIKTMIVSFIQKCRDWDKNLHEIAFAMNSAVSDTTKFSPAYLATGREFRCPLDNILDVASKHHEIVQFKERMALIHNLARENIEASHEVSLRAYGDKVKYREFKIGDLVMVKTHFLSNAGAGFSAKLAPRYEGPYRITHKVSNHAYDLTHDSSGQVIHKCHVNDMFRYVSA